MQYKVPQNVDIEDKVIGPLTIRQFIIILVAVGILLILYFLLVGPLRILFYVAALLIGGGALALAFYKYGDQNAEVFVLSAVNTFMHPRKRVWKKEEYKEEKPKPEPKKKEESPEEKRADIKDARSGLEKLAEVVDSGGYSTLSGGRKGTTPSTPAEPVDAEDIIQKSQNKQESVDALMNQAEKSTPKREELVSEAASVKPDISQKETPTIKLRKDQYYKNIK